MKERELPATFVELYRAERFDYWGDPEAAPEDRERLFEARRHLVLAWESIEWDRSLDEIVSYAGEEQVRPGLLPFAGDGYGNAYCWYPPWQKGEEPPLAILVRKDLSSSTVDSKNRPDHSGSSFQLPGSTVEPGSFARFVTS